jgi:hypothetical protein
MRKSARTRTGILARCRRVPALGLLACLLCYPIDLHAQGRVVAQEPLDIVIQAASSLSLRIGTTGGTIDRVTFTATQLPGTGAVAGVSSGANPVPVRATSSPTSARKVLTADSSIALNDGAGHTIPFTQISWTGTNNVPSGTFAGSSSQQIFSTTTQINSGTMSFSYANTVYVPSGTYNARVTYTLSSP